MADRTLDDADLVVDELKRKARRRLVGAIVLSLTVIVFIPLLLEKEPRKLGDDVSIQIPPVDDSKFVNRLNVDKTKDASAGAKPAAPAAATNGSASPPEAKSESSAPSPAGKAESSAAAPVASSATAPTTTPAAAPTTSAAT